MNAISNAPRVVVTGDRAGRSGVDRDDLIDEMTRIPGMPAVLARDLWTSGSAPAPLTSTDIAPAPASLGAPTGGGHIVRLLEIEPDPPGYDVRSGWHATPTLDHVIVLSGEIVCVLDDGEVVLHAGDLLVQRGTPHAWSNRGSEPCRMIGILVDATA